MGEYVSDGVDGDESEGRQRPDRRGAPELAGPVAAVSYDPDPGQLTVCPETSAWATWARLEQSRVIAAANAAAARTFVRALRILPPGAPAPDLAVVACGPGRRLHEVATPRRVDPGIAEALERQTAAMRELSRRAFPETDVVVPDDAPAPIEAARAQRRRQAAVTEAAAMRRARRERAAGASGREISTERKSA